MFVSEADNFSNGVRFDLVKRKRLGNAICYNTSQSYLHHHYSDCVHCDYVLSILPVTAFLNQFLYLPVLN